METSAMNEEDGIEEEDDIIAEIHRIREEIWEKAGGTPEAYGRYYQEKGRQRLAAEAARRAAGEVVERPPMPKLRKSTARSMEEAVENYHRALEEARRNRKAAGTSETEKTSAKQRAKPGTRPGAGKTARKAPKRKAAVSS